MKSIKRKVLKKHLNTRQQFVAVIQQKNTATKKLTLMDVHLYDDGKLKFVSDHMHVINVTDSILSLVTKFDMIYFTAIPYRYTKNNEFNETIYNYSVRFINDLKVLEVHHG